MHSNRAGFWYQKAADWPNAGHWLCAYQFFVILFKALLFQRFLALKNGSEDDIIVVKKVNEVAYAATVVKRKTDGITPNWSWNIESSTYDIDREFHQVEAKKETPQHKLRRKSDKTSSCLVLPIKEGVDPVPVSQKTEEVAKHTYCHALQFFQGMMKCSLVWIIIIIKDLILLNGLTLASIMYWLLWEVGDPCSNLH